jgi:hypothetical protein
MGDFDDSGNRSISRATKTHILVKSDATNQSGYTNKGFKILTAGNIYIQALGDSAITGPMAVVAGDYWCVCLMYFGADSTATAVGYYG